MSKKTNELSRDQWNALRYAISLRELSPEEGGGWLATIPQLGEGAFMADGETPQDAVDALEQLRHDLYDAVINSGQPIPLPVDVTDEVKLPSGKWMMRTMPKFHAELQEAARVSHVSFNAYCNHCLQRGHAIESVAEAVEELCSTVHSSVHKAVYHVAGQTFKQVQFQWNVEQKWASSAGAYDLQSLNKMVAVA